MSAETAVKEILAMERRIILLEHQLELKEHENAALLEDRKLLDWIAETKCTVICTDGIFSVWSYNPEDHEAEINLSSAGVLRSALLIAMTIEDERQTVIAMAEGRSEHDGR